MLRTSVAALALTWLLAAVCHAQTRPGRLRGDHKPAGKLFGSQVRGHQDLFELNKDYVLKLQLGGGGEVVGVSAIPKYYLEETEPQWSEPEYVVGMTAGEYRDVLAKVGKLKSLGPLLHQGSVGVVTNSKLWLLDRYQSAFVQRILNRTARQTGDTPDSIHAFSVYFLRRVEGSVEDKQPPKQIGTDKQWRLKIDGCWYLVPEQEFNKAEPGRRASLYAAGPLKGAGGECPSP